MATTLATTRGYLSIPMVADLVSVSSSETTSRRAEAVVDKDGFAMPCLYNTGSVVLIANLAPDQDDDLSCSVGSSKVQVDETCDVLSISPLISRGLPHSVWGVN
jgi:hypothetical protein